MPRAEVRVVVGRGVPGSLVRGRNVREILGAGAGAGGEAEDADRDGDGDDEGEGDGDGLGSGAPVKKTRGRDEGERGGGVGADGDGRTWFQLRPEMPGSELVDWEDLAEILGDNNITTTTASEAETEDGMDLEQTQTQTEPPPQTQILDAPLDAPIPASFRHRHKLPNPNAPFSISTKEVVLKRFFPKYEPCLEGLPAGRIYLRHKVDRFEFRPFAGWGSPSSSSPRRETTDDGKGKAKAKMAKTKERLLQWSFTRGTWMFVMDELPSDDRPHRTTGYPLPDRGDVLVLGLAAGTKTRKEGKPTTSFLTQGHVVVAKDSEMLVRQFPECAVPSSYVAAADKGDTAEDAPRDKGPEGADEQRDEEGLPPVRVWEWVMPVKESLWVPPMHGIVRKFGEGARPVWDLGGRMLWDVVRGQWIFLVCDALGEMEELVDRPPVVRERDAEGADEVMRVAEEGATPIGKARRIYDVCVGGRPRFEWDAFHRAREYLVRSFHSRESSRSADRGPFTSSSARVAQGGRGTTESPSDHCHRPD